eukprot:gnl/TRDRNA2_/TRDRNA2_48855_c0_seq1.p1 gnl/TRDRNA2_/TRDRNA2_48855_c0~~gnl/TRDRNA2_/TRDRNA2_48855_c0_seq1.p1  ORF type:complete len:367 (-),score=64.60 gnl/TRDRNA2_/TRDRNA2_48855_c0_seq1:37-1062(-)
MGFAALHRLAPHNRGRGGLEPVIAYEYIKVPLPGDPGAPFPFSPGDINETLPDGSAFPPLEPEEGFVDITPGKDGGLLKKILQEGAGQRVPTGSLVKMHYVGTLHSDGEEFDSSRERNETLEVFIGRRMTVKALEIGVCTMKCGEKAILRSRADYGYGDRGAPGSPNEVPANATLNFEVEVLNFTEHRKEPCQMMYAERCETARTLKELGTEAFNLKELAKALKHYEDGASYITFKTKAWLPINPEIRKPPSDTPQWNIVELHEEDLAMAVALLNNCALLRLKLGDPELAKSDCSRAIELEAKNVKAHYRRAQAYLNTSYFVMERAAEEGVFEGLEVTFSE